MIFNKCIAAWVLLALGTVGATSFGLFGFGALKHGYAWNEMDWNEDGKTTIAEFLRSADIGKRQVQIDNMTCIEFYEFKDGLQIRTICPAPPADR